MVQNYFRLPSQGLLPISYLKDKWWQLHTNTNLRKLVRRFGVELLRNFENLVIYRESLEVPLLTMHVIFLHGLVELTDV